MQGSDELFGLPIVMDTSREVIAVGHKALPLRSRRACRRSLHLSRSAPLALRASRHPRRCPSASLPAVLCAAPDD